MIDMMKSLQDSGSPYALITVVKASSSTPRKQGARMIVETGGRATGTIGGGPVEKRAMAAGQEMLFAGSEAAFMEFSLDDPNEVSSNALEIDSIYGGSMSLFIQCFHPPASLLIVGGGHIAKFLYEQAHDMDFGITVVDNREEFASQNRFPKACVINGNYRETLSTIPFNSPAYIVIMTHGHEFDEMVLDTVLERECDKICYVGMIGSARKVKTILENLLEKGADPAKIGRVRAPIGLKIGAATPQEIAIAIMAEIISVRRGMDFNNSHIMSIDGPLC